MATYYENIVTLADDQSAQATKTESLSAIVGTAAGELISNYLDENWAAEMIDPNAVFGPNALRLTSYTFEILLDEYLIDIDDWCETQDPARFTALLGNCNGVLIDGFNNTYATALSDLTVLNFQLRIP